MTTTRMKLDVEYDDGTEQTVVADQRDIVIYEREAKISYVTGLQTAYISMNRHIAYLALKRQGLLSDPKVTRDAWEAIVPSVVLDMSEPADPTKPVAAEDTSSDSPSLPVKASRRSPRTGSRKT